MAVLLVVVYHAGLALPGGYVGVDVFFVISGFLITQQLLAEHGRTGRIAVLEFYGRRIRRLLPAAALVLVVTLIAGREVLPPAEVPILSADARMTALYVPNVLFAQRGLAYLQSDIVSPLEHYWSLAVEEQFYAFWPLLLLLVLRLVPHRLPHVLATLALGSLALCIALTSTRQPWAFFLLPPRAWELVVGALLAVGATRLSRLSASSAAALGWGGLVLIATAACAYDDATAFPGPGALLPVAGAAAVIASGTREASPGGPLAVLSGRPVQLLGRWSYALYLWHWPLLVLARTRHGDELPLAASAVILLLSVVLAAATHEALEHPLRTSARLRASLPASFAMGGALTATGVAGAALLATAVPGVPTGHTVGPPPSLGTGLAQPTHRIPADLQPSLAQSRHDVPRVYADGCHVDTLSLAVDPCTYGNPYGPTVVLAGDSKAAQWFPALHALAVQHGWRLVSLTKSSCPLHDVAVLNALVRREYDECATWRSRVLARVAAEQPELLIVAGHRGYAPATHVADVAAWWATGLRHTLVRVPARTRILVLGDTPHLRRAAPTCLATPPHDPERCSTARAAATDLRHSAAERRKARAAGATYADPTNWLCTPLRCRVLAGNVLVYRDAEHVTTRASLLLAPQLWSVIDGTPGLIAAG